MSAQPVQQPQPWSYYAMVTAPKGTDIAKVVDVIVAGLKEKGCSIGNIVTGEGRQTAILPKAPTLDKNIGVAPWELTYTGPWALVSYKHENWPCQAATRLNELLQGSELARVPGLSVYLTQGRQVA